MLIFNEKITISVFILEYCVSLFSPVYSKVFRNMEV